MALNSGEGFGSYSKSKDVWRAVDGICQLNTLSRPYVVGPMTSKFQQKYFKMKYEHHHNSVYTKK